VLTQLNRALDVAQKTFVGFGFGAIQAGLFLFEAHRSGLFGRLVVAEVIPEVVDAIRASAGRYRINVATRSGIEKHEVKGVEILNPRVPRDRTVLIRRIAESSEIATALPSVDFYGSDKKDDVVGILRAGLQRKPDGAKFPPAIIYAAENNNHAAEILAELLLKSSRRRPAAESFECLNTVIGKMSGVVTDTKQMAEQALAPVAGRLDRAFLVEEFNRILISRIQRPGFERGITVFEEKKDLLPFEEAKLYGHNATHALLGYLLLMRGAALMSEARQDHGLMRLVRDAFLEESGKTLCRKYAGLDELFTEAGYREYADGLIERMLNPHLCDTVERITRDPRRKLGWNDRLVGTMRVALGQGIVPHRYAKGAAAALAVLQDEQKSDAEEILNGIWQDVNVDKAEREEITELILSSDPARTDTTP